MIYRGYDIWKTGVGYYASKDGKNLHLHEVATEEQAMGLVDSQIRKEEQFQMISPFHKKIVHGTLAYLRRKDGSVIGGGHCSDVDEKDHKVQLIKAVERAIMHKDNDVTELDHIDIVTKTDYV